MHGRSIPVWGFVLSLFALSCPTARAEEPRVTPKIVTWAAPAGQEHFFGVMGPVARPGIFRAAQPLTMQQLVSAAGGLTPDTLPSVLLVRQGRLTQRIYWNPTGRDALLPGDVLIVEPAAHRRAAPEEGVQLAFVGVLPRPIIVRIKPEQAQLAGVCQMLGQSPELAAKVQLRHASLHPEAPNYRRDLPGGDSLADGTVLLFDPALINRSALPAFPEPVDYATLPGVTAAGPALAQSHPPLAVQAVSQRRPTAEETAEIGVGLPPTDARPSPPRSGPSSGLTPPSLTGREAVVSEPRDERPVVTPGPLAVSTLPYAEAETGRTPSPRLSRPQGETSSASMARTTLPSPEPAREQSDDLLKEFTDEADADADDGEPGKIVAAGFSVWQMCGIVATVASLIGVALITSRVVEQPAAPVARPIAAGTRPAARPAMPPAMPASRAEIRTAADPHAELPPSPPIVSGPPARPSWSVTPLTPSSPNTPEPPSPPPASRVVSRLEALIRNELTLVEEPTSLPTQLELRETLPDAPSWVRFDPPEPPLTEASGQTPHFQSSPRVQPAAPARPEPLPSQTAGMSGPGRSTAGLSIPGVTIMRQPASSAPSAPAVPLEKRMADAASPELKGPHFAAGAPAGRPAPPIAAPLERALVSLQGERRS